MNSKFHNSQFYKDKNVSSIAQNCFIAFGKVFIVVSNNSYTFVTIIYL